MARGVGREYVHVAIDDATRVAGVEARRSQRRRACAAFLRNAVAWIRRRGVIIRRVLTDNVSGYKSRRFAGVRRTWQHRLTFTRLYTPRSRPDVMPCGALAAESGRESLCAKRARVIQAA